MKKPLVIGIGNPYRGDDAAGLEVTRQLQEGYADFIDAAYCKGNTMDLLEMWRGRDKVILIDAVFSGKEETGFLYRFEPLKKEVPAFFNQSSTHLLDVVQVIELGKALQNVPNHLLLYGIESKNFGQHEGISEILAGKLASIAEKIASDLDLLHKSITTEITKNTEIF